MLLHCALQVAHDVHDVLCMTAHPDVLEVPTRLFDVDTPIEGHPAPSEEPATELETWMYFKNWISDWQNGNALIIVPVATRGTAAK